MLEDGEGDAADLACCQLLPVSSAEISKYLAHGGIVFVIVVAQAHMYNVDRLLDDEFILTRPAYWERELFQTFCKLLTL